MTTMGPRARSFARTLGWRLVGFLRRQGIDLARFPRPESIDHLIRTVIDQYEVDLALDVGANTGLWASSLRSLGYQGHLVSFEPVAETFRALDRRAVRDPLWSAVPLALGDTDGESSMNVTVSSRTSSLLEPTQRYVKRYEGAQVSRSETVAVRRLDTVWDRYCPNHAKRALLKIDTQGYDHNVLRGGSGVLDHIVAVQIELSVVATYEQAAGWRTVVDWLEDRGFALSGLFPTARDDELRMTEMDGLFVKPSA